MTVESSRPPELQVLVVDDDPLNRRMMELILSRQGHHVEMAINGLEAVDALKARRFDIVFMDLQMPVMDGMEASRQIRQMETDQQRTFIVALTASYLPEQGEELYAAGIDNYLAKPFEVEHVLRMLKYRSDAIEAAVSKIEIPHPAEISITDVLDFQIGVKRIGGDLEVYWELLNDFIDELPDKIDKIQQFYDAKDLDALARAAHNLKGVSANLGILQLSKYADRLDKQTTAGYTDDLAQTIKEITATARKLVEIARIFLAGRKIHDR